MAWSTAASAGLVTVNFPGDVVAGTTPFSGPSFSSSFNNATASGLRLSPSCEFDLGAGPAGLSWDRSGCVGSQPNVFGFTGLNPNYLGSSVVGASSLYVDHGGADFSLVSADLVSAGADGFEVISSKGGVFLVPKSGPAPEEFDFVGPGWDDIKWLIFGYDDVGAPQAGFDQLVVDMPEPLGGGLLGGALVLLLMLRRRISAG